MPISIPVGFCGLCHRGGALYLFGMNSGHGMVMTTFPDPEAARRIADGLLERHLAACVQTLPIQSAYRWKGAVHHEAEILALIKTRVALYPAVEAYLRSVHPYETPEIVLTPLTGGLLEYLGWIDSETEEPGS